MLFKCDQCGLLLISNFHYYLTFFSHCDGLVIFSCDKYNILIFRPCFRKKKSVKMEILAGGLAASGACLFTNPLEVGIK